MVRPKKPRYIDGVQLEDNLYPDNKGRKGHFRYLRPDNTFKYFQADTIHRANEAAKKANSQRDSYVPIEMQREDLTLIGIYAEDFITHRELHSPDLKSARSWDNRKYTLRKFAREFTMSPSKLTRQHIEEWWHGLTYNNQKLRHAEFRRFFNYMMGRNVCTKLKYNPFTTADDRPRLYLRSKPARSRIRLDLTGFWKIYHAASKLNYPGLQIAMGLSLLTFMREGDILSLRFEHIDEDFLKKTINKSAAQKGHVNATRLQWNMDQYKPLRQLINRARELSLKNQRCPYVISHMPKQRRKGKTKDHIAKVTPKRLQEMFAEARDATNIWAEIGKDQTAPTFHEVRSLADALAASNKFNTKLIQEAMAHSNEAMTLMYQSEHDMPYTEVGVYFTEKMIEGSFE